MEPTRYPTKTPIQQHVTLLITLQTAVTEIQQTTTDPAPQDSLEESIDSNETWFDKLGDIDLIIVAACGSFLCLMLGIIMLCKVRHRAKRIKKIEKMVAEMNKKVSIPHTSNIVKLNAMTSPTTIKLNEIINEREESVRNRQMSVMTQNIINIDDEEELLRTGTLDAFDIELTDDDSIVDDLNNTEFNETATHGIDMDQGEDEKEEEDEDADEYSSELEGMYDEHLKLPNKHNNKLSINQDDTVTIVCSPAPPPSIGATYNSEGIEKKLL